MSSDQSSSDLNEAEFIRTAVSELNESIAYLSKMVLQLQRSINEQKSNKKTPVQTTAKASAPKTIH